MDSSRERQIVGIGEAARTALEGTRGAARQPDAPSRIRLGIVTAFSGSSYTVGVVGATGATVDSIDGVRAWGSGTFNVSDRVMLVWIGDRPIPFIMAGGSGVGDSATYVVAGFIRFFS